MVMQMKAKIKIMRNREKKKNITKDRPQKKNIKSNNIQEPSALSTNGILFHEKKTTKILILFLFFTRKLFVYSHTLYCYNNFGLQKSIYIWFLFIHFIFVLFQLSTSFCFFFFENFYLFDLLVNTYIKKQRFPISFFFHFFFF